MSDFMKALDKYMAENADLEQAIETINKMAEALRMVNYINQYNHINIGGEFFKPWDAGEIDGCTPKEAFDSVQSCLKLAEPYLRGK